MLPHRLVRKPNFMRLANVPKGSTQPRLTIPEFQTCHYLRDYRDDTLGVFQGLDYQRRLTCYPSNVMARRSAVREINYRRAQDTDSPNLRSWP